MCVCLCASVQVSVCACERWESDKEEKSKLVERKVCRPKLFICIWKKCAHSLSVQTSLLMTVRNSRQCTTVWRNISLFTVHLQEKCRFSGERTVFYRHAFLTIYFCSVAGQHRIYVSRKPLRWCNCVLCYLLVHLTLMWVWESRNVTR